MRVDLPDGQWAEIVEPDQLRRADQKAALKHSVMEITSEGVAYVRGDQDAEVQDALLGRVLVNWSFPFPLPKDDPDSLGKLTIAQGDALAKAIKPHLDLIFAKNDPTKRGSDPTSASSS